MLSDNERASLVYNMLSEIKNQDHRVALLLQMQGCSLADMKKILLKDSVDTLKIYVFRAKQDLRNIIRREKN